MAFDKPTRNRLASLVADARRLVAEEFTLQFQSLYGISEKGEMTTLHQLGHLDDTGLATATLLRQRIDYIIRTHPDDKNGASAAVSRLAREQAFTIINRLAAIRMAEKRGIIIESVGKGYQSKGFKVFEQIAGSGLGDAYHRYRRYLFCLFDELAEDLGILFDRRSAQGLLFPREPALQGLFDLLNAADLDPLWSEDETIGWVYQYYNDPAERKKMRDESSAPRNSRELAVRNQFFTPRYVVEFLTDNTLGRIWYEMTQGQTLLKEQCRFLVRRPDQIFLVESDSDEVRAAQAWLQTCDGERPDLWHLAHTVNGYLRTGGAGEASNRWVEERLPRIKDDTVAELSTQELLDLLFLCCRKERFCEGILDSLKSEIELIISAIENRNAKARRTDLSQEDLLKQPVFIPYRPIKDPRTILMLDPACGSMHFGLYAFDLLEVIYGEAWELEEDLGVNALSRPSGMKSLHDTYADKDAFLNDVPRLIIEHNIHGIDIDPRAVQIAGLSLWLRAQRAWQALGVNAADRPQIKKTNIVCAEPMPGEQEMLREFTQNLQPRVLGQLVEIIFDRMKLAGEAGSLLKIEEEIEGAIEQAREAFNKEIIRRRSGRQDNLFPEIEPPHQGSLFDFADLPNTTQFWDNAERRIIEALRDYAEQAENGGGFQRRLFAEDAARGFAFIDVCRKRYDVALMNPPFGVATDRIFEWLKIRSPDTYTEMFASFAARGLQMLAVGGRVGAITSRAFLTIKRLHEWRKKQVLRAIELLLDLGGAVMDSALVESCAYILKEGEVSPQIYAIDARQTRGNADTSADCDLLKAKESEHFSVNRSDLERLPGAKLLYSIPGDIHELLRTAQPFEPLVGTVRQGMGTFDDFRFVHLRWEVPADKIGRGMIWELLAKGGAYARFYSDIHLMLNWASDGKELGEVNIQHNGQVSQVRQASDYWRKGGCTYSKRSQKGFSARALPSNCIITGKGPAILTLSEIPNDYLLGWLNSRLIKFLIELQANYAEFNTGILKMLPWKHPPAGSTVELARGASDCALKLRNLDGASETNSIFVGFSNIHSLSELTATLNSQRIACGEFVAALSCKWDEHVDTVYAVDSSNLDRQLSVEADESSEAGADDETLADEQAFSAAECVQRVISYLLGIAFARWDIRYATGELAAPELPDPFAPLPVCPPGQLQNAQGLPARPEDVPAAYPVRIPWNGILVDDPNNSLDIERRVREVIEINWKNRAEAIEHEACGLLGVKSLRDYFRKPAGFFADHLKRYSKSRRQAPIYWPLSSAKGSYTLWIYYHRLTDQTLHTALADFVDPKLKSIRAELTSLRETTVHHARLEELLDLEKELEDFRAEIERIIKLPWKPNLNDGVLITASPLWKLSRLPKWQKDLKACWEELAEGDYDWSHLAHTLWPKRVEEKCKMDRSIAIAHGLEHLCLAEAPKPKAKRGKKKVVDEDPFATVE